jgi:hypothetical protein
MYLTFFSSAEDAVTRVAFVQHLEGEGKEWAVEYTMMGIDDTDWRYKTYGVR